MNKNVLNLANKIWIKIPVVLAVALMLIMSVSKLYPVNNVNSGDSLKEFTSYLDNHIPELMKAYEIPGVSIALVEEGSIEWMNAYGNVDAESGKKMTTKTNLRVQSISKSVTAWGVMKLIEQGKLELDSPVKQYIKNWDFPESATEEITVKQLLSHTAGLPLGDIFNCYSPTEVMPTLEECLTNEVCIFQEPGLSFSYSNTGYNLLELLIEEVTGIDFADYMKTEVLVPLGMRGSTFNWDSAIDKESPAGYDLNGKAVPAYVYPEKASGGLFSNVEDIGAFIAAGMPALNKEQKVLKPENIELLYTPVVEGLGIYGLVFDSYGLGYYIEELPDGRRAFSHGGQGTGVMTHFHTVPETGDGIVILTNSQRSWPFISYILSDWAQWNDFSPIGMSRIVLGIYALWVFIGIIFAVVFLQLWQLALGLVSGTRMFSPLWKEIRLRRMLQTSLSLAILISLIWCISQDYLFISSIFPIAAKWLFAAAFALAVVLMVSSLFPVKVKNKVLA